MEESLQKETEVIPVSRLVAFILILVFLEITEK